MAPLVNLGQPFGAPSRTFNVAAPAGIGQALANQQQTFDRAMSTLGQALGQRRQNKLESEDFDKISQIFNPQPQISNLDQSGQAIGEAFLGGQAPQGVQTQTPGVNLSSPQSLAILGSLQSNFGKDFAKKVTTARLAQQFQPPILRGPGEQLVDERGQPIGEAGAFQPRATKAFSIERELIDDPKSPTKFSVIKRDQNGNAIGTRTATAKEVRQGVVADPTTGLSAKDKSTLGIAQSEAFAKRPVVKNFRIVEGMERNIRIE